ncbi:MAG: hypothetical protein WCD66_08110 [Rhodanobacteraceae bacterium]
MKNALCRTLTLTLACSIAFVAAAQAADSEKAPEKAMMVYDVTVQPSHVSAFEKGIKGWIACQHEHGRKQGFSAWEAETGKSEYTFTSPSGTWASFDEKDEGAKACSQNFMDNVMPHVDSMLSSVYEDMPELSKPPADDSSDTPKYVVVTGYRIKPGKFSDFKDATAKMTKAAVQSKWSPTWWTSSLAFGDREAADVIMVGPENSWASIGAPTDPKTMDMMKGVYGEDETKALYKKFMGSAKFLSRNVYRYNKDLSYIPAD